MDDITEAKRALAIAIRLTGQERLVEAALFARQAYVALQRATKALACSPSSAPP